MVTRLHLVYSQPLKTNSRLDCSENPRHAPGTFQALNPLTWLNELNPKILAISHQNFGVATNAELEFRPLVSVMVIDRVQVAEAQGGAGGEMPGFILGIPSCSGPCQPLGGTVHKSTGESEISISFSEQNGRVTRDVHVLESGK